MNILDKIIASKKETLAKARKEKSISQLKESAFFHQVPPSFSEYIQKDGLSGIISEFKRRSPSKGLINGGAKVEDVVRGYEKAGASAVSVLTDSEFFGGSNEDLSAAREAIDLPILRKDFIIDEFQVYEAKSIGASAILLIAACLEPSQVKKLMQCAHSINLEVLLELHDEEELDCLFPEVDVVGINNRNLKTFEVDLEQSIRLSDKIGPGYLKIAESGISSVENILYLKEKGFRGFLIGENFMKTDNPGEAAISFIQQLKQKA